MTQAKTLDARLSASSVVAQTDSNVALASVTSEWQQLKGPQVAGEEGLIDAMTSSGQSGAIKELTRRYFDRPNQIRFAIVSLFASDEMPPNGGYYTARWNFPKTTEGTAAYMAAVEELLGLALADQELMAGQSGSYGGYEFENPKIAYTAAYALSQCFPKRYSFPKAISWFDAESNLARSLNVWRQGRGLAALPLPTRPYLPKIKPEILDPLLTNLLKATTKQGSDGSARAIRDLGLPALSGVLSRQTFVKNAALDKLAIDMSNTIRSVDIQGDPQSKLWLSRVRQLVGQTMNPDVLRKEIDLLVKSWPKEAKSLVIRAERDQFAAGFSVEVLSRPRSNGGYDGMWSFARYVSVDGSNYYNSIGGGSEFQDENFGKALSKALKSKPNQMVSLFISLGKSPD